MDDRPQGRCGFDILIFREVWPYLTGQITFGEVYNTYKLSFLIILSGAIIC